VPYTALHSTAAPPAHTHHTHTSQHAAPGEMTYAASGWMWSRALDRIKCTSPRTLIFLTNLEDSCSWFSRMRWMMFRTDRSQSLLEMTHTGRHGEPHAHRPREVMMWGGAGRCLRCAPADLVEDAHLLGHRVWVCRPRSHIHMHTSHTTVSAGQLLPRGLNGHPESEQMNHLPYC
jgi:hypothetical protein